MTSKTSLTNWLNPWSYFQGPQAEVSQELQRVQSVYKATVSEAAIHSPKSAKIWTADVESIVIDMTSGRPLEGLEMAQKQVLKSGSTYLSLLPGDAVEFLSNIMKKEDSTKLADLNLHTKVRIQQGFIARAQRFGYLGNSYEDANRHMEGLKVVFEDFERFYVDKRENFPNVYRFFRKFIRDHDFESFAEKLHLLSPKEFIQLIHTSNFRGATICFNLFLYKIANSENFDKSKFNQPAIIEGLIENAARVIIHAPDLTEHALKFLHSCINNSLTQEGENCFHRIFLLTYRDNGNNVPYVCKMTPEQRTQVIEAFLKMGYDPHVSSATSQPFTPLQRAIECDIPEFVKAMLKASSNSSLRYLNTPPDRYPLRLAYGKWSCITRFLVDHGFDPFHPDGSGFTIIDKIVRDIGKEFNFYYLDLARELFFHLERVQDNETRSVLNRSLEELTKTIKKVSNLKQAKLLYELINLLIKKGAEWTPQALETLKQNLQFQIIKEALALHSPEEMDILGQAQQRLMREVERERLRADYNQSVADDRAKEIQQLKDTADPRAKENLQLKTEAADREKRLKELEEQNAKLQEQLRQLSHDVERRKRLERLSRR